MLSIWSCPNLLFGKGLRSRKYLINHLLHCPGLMTLRKKPIEQFLEKKMLVKSSFACVCHVARFHPITDRN